MLFITYYAVIGSRCTGTYLVNAPNKREANKIVKAFDIDYTRITSTSQAEFVKLDGQEEWDMMIEDIEIPKEGEASHIESGT